MKKIRSCLWFDDQAEEAVNFYVSVFQNSKVFNIIRYGDAGPGTKGEVMYINFQIEGQEFMALNGGPHFSFTPAISFFVDCESQKEVDVLWERLLDGGEEEQCGWLKDKYGVSWQIIPSGLVEMLYGAESEKSRSALEAMLKMQKIDIEEIRQAYEQG